MVLPVKVMGAAAVVWKFGKLTVATVLFVLKLKLTGAREALALDKADCRLPDEMGLEGREKEEVGLKVVVVPDSDDAGRNVVELVLCLTPVAVGVLPEVLLAPP